MDYQSAVERVIADPRYLKNIEFGEPRSGHPEGKIKNHIAHLEINLEQLKHRLPDDETYWKLKFLIHVHDTFKPDATQTGTSPDKPYSHASLARAFASEFVTDQDILNIIQYHDEDYALWKYFQRTGQYDEERLEILLNTIQDWDLYLAFIIVDGSTEGKVLEKLPWFINWVRQYKSTQVDETWTHLKPLEL